MAATAEKLFLDFSLALLNGTAGCIGGLPQSDSQKTHTLAPPACRPDRHNCIFSAALTINIKRCAAETSAAHAGIFEDGLCSSAAAATGDRSYQIIDFAGDGAYLIQLIFNGGKTVGTVLQHCTDVASAASFTGAGGRAGEGLFRGRNKVRLNAVVPVPAATAAVRAAAGVAAAVRAATGVAAAVRAAAGVAATVRAAARVAATVGATVRAAAGVAAAVRATVRAAAAVRAAAPATTPAGVASAPAVTAAIGAAATAATAGVAAGTGGAKAAGFQVVAVKGAAVINGHFFSSHQFETADILRVVFRRGFLRADGSDTACHFII